MVKKRGSYRIINYDDKEDYDNFEGLDEEEKPKIAA